MIVYSPMANGLLSGKVTREYMASLPVDDPLHENDDYKEPRISQILGLVDTLREIGLAHHRSIGEVAVAWVLRQPAVTGAIAGLRRPAHVDAIVAAAELRLLDDDPALTMPEGFAKLLPKPGGTVFFYATAQPYSQGSMHATDTVDYIIIVSGEIWLVLEGGDEVFLTAGDCVVQTGNLHAWHNRSPEPCTLAVIMVGAEMK